MGGRYQGSAEAGVAGFMCSYSSISFTDHPERATNAPACASEYLLTEVIRKGWNWTGWVGAVGGWVGAVGGCGGWVRWVGAVGAAVA